VTSTTTINTPAIGEPIEMKTAVLGTRCFSGVTGSHGLRASSGAIPPKARIVNHGWGARVQWRYGLNFPAVPQLEHAADWERLVSTQGEECSTSLEKLDGNKKGRLWPALPSVAQASARPPR